MPTHRSTQKASQISIDRLKQSALESQVSIPDSEMAFISPQLMECSFEKHDYLIQAGDVVQYFYFILEGLVRLFYSTEDGKEFNKGFAMENGYAGSFHSLVLQAPCGFFVQALERTQALILPNQLLRGLYARHACWERLGRRNAENLAIVKEAREKELLLDSLETRYRRFLKEYPGLAERIPQYHIASYLGVTTVALSRIRRKINLG